MSTPTIVVTDHEEAYLELVRELLESEGYPRVICKRGERAWEAILGEEVVSLVFVSVTLNNRDEAWSLLDKLRLHPATATVPVILAATDMRLVQAKAEHLASLNCATLEKPFLITTLFDLVVQLIGPPPAKERTA